MKPKLYYSCINKIAFDNFCSDAAIGARDEDIETIGFEDISEVPYDPYHIVVASVEDTLQYLGKEVNVIDHSWASKFLKRDFEQFESLKHIDQWPCFVKPAKDIKAFTGFVSDSYQMAMMMSYDYEGPVVRQKIINIESEYRVYISSLRGILGVKHYLGDPYLTLDKDFVNECFLESKKRLTENSYTLDFGVDDKGETFLIEVNDGWAIGNYGLEPKTYYHFVKNRFLQLTNVLK